MAQSKWRTAYHEAGHAVAYYVLGIEHGYVTIRPKDGDVGHTTHHDGWLLGPEGWSLSREDGENQIIACYAGREAEQRAFPAAPLAELEEGAASDDEYAAEYLRSLGGGDEQALRARARNFLAEHWSKVEAVAAQLIEHEWLEETEIEFICDGEMAGLETYRQLFAGSLERTRRETT
jgi:ATP-dependent Zn protease